MADLIVSQPPRVDLTHYFVDNFYLEVTVQDENGSDFDFTGYTGVMNIKSNITSSTSLVSPTVTFGTSKIIASCDIANYSTLTPGGKYSYHLILSDNLSRPKAWIAGAYHFSKDPQDECASTSNVTVTLSTNTLDFTITTVAGYLASQYVYNESLSGTKNGINKTFTSAYTPISGNTEQIYYNGQRLALNVGYTISGATITLAAATPAPESGDTLTMDYIKV